MQRFSFRLICGIVGTLIFLSLSVVSCGHKKENAVKAVFQETKRVVPKINPQGKTIHTRFLLPNGFHRMGVDQNSFAAYLRNFPLLEDGSSVHLYNGQLKPNQSVHAAVLDIDVGAKDLQQCADAVMRLRAEYLYEQEKYEEIAFEFTNRWKFEYSKWRDGNSVKVDGNKTYWVEGSTKKESYDDFRRYMDWVFMYSGTLSLSNELQSKPLNEIEIGDIFIKGGSPGHAVLVVDLARNETTGEIAFMLAQSYMPAQQIHVLKNFQNTSISPWYFLSEVSQKLMTPEWSFSNDALKGF